MQAGILDWEKPEKDGKTILREEKIRRHKKDRKRKSIKESNSEDWSGKNRYTVKNYSRSIVE